MSKNHIFIKKKRISHPISLIILSLLSVLLILPVALTFFYSIISDGDIINLTKHVNSEFKNLIFIPHMVSIGQYYKIMIGQSDILNRYIYSAFYASSVLLLQTIIVPAMAYSLSTFKFKGRDAIFMMLILLMLLPFQVTMVPNVIMLRSINLLDTVWAIILPMTFTPFYIFLIRQYMLSISRELYESAQLDGAGPIRSFFYIALPLSKPVLGAAAALSFADLWNMVEQPLTLLSHREDLMPLSTVFNNITHSTSMIEYAGATIYILPALFIYLFFQDDIVSGIQLSDTK